MDASIFLRKDNNCSMCIAGGAVRDVLLNKPVKDLDVFFFRHQGPP